jgi:DNA-binding transcriptional LysR family regulator
MELRQLEAFVAVAEEQNFTRAAERLFVAQSGLSATIRTLEKDLHAPLFDRSTRRVDLTPAGVALLVEARRTLAAARAARDVVAAIEGLQRGTLTIGVVQASGLFNLAGLLARYRRAYPPIRLRLVHASSAELIQLLVDAEIDVAFASPCGEASADILSLPLVESPLVAVCQAGSTFADRDEVTIAELADRDQVGFSKGWSIRTLADHAVRSVGLEPRIDLEVNDTDTLVDLVQSGLGVALLPEAIATKRPKLHQATISDGRWVWTVAALTLAPQPVNPAARAFWGMLRSQPSVSKIPALPVKTRAHRRRSPSDRG